MMSCYGAGAARAHDGRVRVPHPGHARDEHQGRAGGARAPMLFVNGREHLQYALVNACMLCYGICYAMEVRKQHSHGMA